MDNPEKLTNKR